VGPDKPRECFGGDMQHGRVIGRCVMRPEILLNQALEVRQRLRKPTLRAAGQLLLLELESRSSDEEGLQVRKQYLGMRQTALLQLASYLIKQQGNLTRMAVLKSDARNAIGVVEKHSVAANLLVVRFDAKKVGVELQAESTHG
jgi:hypothetical protein